MKEKVSVIIPIYNKEKYIQKCIDSLIAQNYDNLEIVAVNDGSSDGSVNVLNRYGDRIKLINVENGGAARARNIGLSNATGDLIFFLDPDDYYEKNTINDIVNFRRETDADIVRFGYKIFLPNGDIKYPNSPFPKNRKIEKNEFKKEIYPHFVNSIALNSVCFVMYKKSCIDGLKFKENMKTAEDAVFNLEAFTNAQSAACLDFMYYCYVKNSESLTEKGLSIGAKYRNNFLYSKEILRHLKIWGMNSVYWRIRTYIRPVIITLDKIFRKLGV